MISIALLLFLIIDPFGNMIVVNSLISELPGRSQAKIVFREGAIATAILLAAAIFGSAVLNALGLEQHSLRLAGGIILFLIALGMLFPTRRILDEPTTDSPLVVPIAMPLIAGPSAISMVVLFAEKKPIAMVLGGVVIATTTATLLLSLSTRIYKILGRRGAIAVERLMGMLLIMLSVQMILDGINAFLDARI